jgi:flagellar biosynthesis/type III secretory pathway M-ring protein FliF/YscJ
MDVFKTQFEQIKKQFGALTATQKMLVFALVAVMGLTLVYWSRFAGSSEMVSLMGAQTLTESELGGIDEVLTMRGIDHTMQTGKMLVPTDLKTQALAVLMFNHKLPSDTRSAFEEMSKSLTAFSPASERDAVYTQALNKEMGSIIAGFPGVASATVVISAKGEQRIEGSVPPTATVSIATKQGEGVEPKKIGRAAADGIAGAVPEMTIAHVSVIVDGTPMRFDENSSGSGGDSDDARREMQKEKEANVHTLYPNIPGLTVVVNFDIDNRKQTIIKKDYDKDHSFVTVAETITNTSETTNTPVKGGEPGVGSNASGANGPANLNGGGGGDVGMASSSNTESERTVNNDRTPTTDTTIEIAAGKPTALSAAVGVPLSYFKSEFHMRHPAAKEPSDDELMAMIKVELAAIQAKISKAVGVKLDDLVVDMYYDAPPEVMPATTAAGPSAAMTLLTAHGKELAVGVLAVASLFLMVMMVRKSSTVTVMTSAGPMTISSLEQAAGGGAGGGGPVVSPNMVATSGSGALDGMELADEDVRTQQMLDQVSTMVKENPDGAAALVKRWLSRA